MSIPAPLVTDAKTKFSLTDPADRASLVKLAEELLALRGLSIEDLRTEVRGAEAPLELKLAAKLVESRRNLLAVDEPVRLGVVFAMWGEQNRLLPQSKDNPNGEDSLCVKLDQLAWATRDTPVEWTLYAVDDGCPHGSAALARERAATHPLGDRVKVLELASELPQSDGPLAPLASAGDSQKGGAVILGCLTAMEERADAVIYTDADGSVHLGQLGLLLPPFVERGTRMVLGDRKHEDAVLVKQESRWGIGIKVLRHLQRRIGEPIFSRGIRDTQSAFKLYAAPLLKEILREPTVYDFSFDTDWILAGLAREERFEKVPFAFIDSFEESASITQGPMTTWIALLHGLAKQVRRHGLPHDEDMARLLVEELPAAADLDLLINHLPTELEDAGDADLGAPGVMSADALRAWVRERKATTG
ncbi:MAG: glycosyltransferase [Acidobacteriota bacterium]